MRSIGTGASDDEPRGSRGGLGLGSVKSEHGTGEACIGLGRGNE